MVSYGKYIQYQQASGGQCDGTYHKPKGSIGDGCDHGGNPRKVPQSSVDAMVSNRFILVKLEKCGSHYYISFYKIGFPV